jgi:voltage-gated potassium channel Kch
MPTNVFDHGLLMTLVVSSSMVALTVMIHFFGLAILIRLLGNRQRDTLGRGQHIARRMLTIMFVVFGLFAVHTIEIWSYAALYYVILDTMTDFETALYFSTVTFVSLGYGDVLLPKQWRLVGAIEAANGVILLGWSTAFLVTVINRLQALEHEWLDR